MNKDKIMGGYLLLARQIYNSSIWVDKPSSWKVIWLYILGNVNYTDNGKFKRGEGFFNFKREIKEVGCDITYDMVRHCLRWLKDESMISTSRSTRGNIIKVLNFDKYQDSSNYQSTQPSTREAQEKHKRSTPIHNKGNKDKKEKNILQSTDCGEFNNNKYIDQLIKDKQRHISVIGKYFKIRRLTFPNKTIAQAELKRWLKDGRFLADFNDKQIDKAYKYVVAQFPDKWTLSTMRKYITDPKIWT